LDDIRWHNAKLSALGPRRVTNNADDIATFNAIVKIGELFGSFVIS
jgi:hypothetical protein